MLWVLLLVAGIAWWLRPRKQGLAPPTLRGALPIIGHTYLVWYLRNSITFWHMVKKLGGYSLQCGGIGKTFLGFWTVYIITDPDASNTLLNTCLEKDDVYKLWKPWLGLGLVTAPVPVWRAHKKLILPTFSQQMLKEYLVIFNETANKIVQKVGARVGKGKFNVYGDLSYGILKTVLTTTMGYKPDNEEDIQLYLHNVEEFHNIVARRGVRVLYHIDAIYKWSNLKKDQDRVTKVLHAFTDKMLKLRRKTFSENSNSKSKIFLDHLLESQDKGIINESEVKGEVDTLVFAGFDTSATTTLFALVIIGSFPEVQERLYREIIDVLGQGEVNVRMDDISKLVYLDAVFKESIRFCPFSSFLGREMDRDLVLKGYTIPHGSRVLILSHSVHRHSVWGSDADEFKPERWLDPSRVPASPGAFNGFSVGKRACIGKRYAELIIKTILIHIVRKYCVTANCKDMVLKFEGMTKPASGHLISVELR